MRLLAWIIFILLVLWAMSKNKKTSGTSSPFGYSRNPPTTGESGVEAMLCCEHCQIHFPASEAVMRGQHVYCSVAHADLH